MGLSSKPAVEHSHVAVNSESYLRRSISQRPRSSPYISRNSNQKLCGSCLQASLPPFLLPQNRRSWVGDFSLPLQVSGPQRACVTPTASYSYLTAPVYGRQACFAGHNLHGYSSLDHLHAACASYHGDYIVLISIAHLMSRGGN